MRIIKNSTNIPNEYIREIFGFVKPHNVRSSGLQITVRNSRLFSAHWTLTYDKKGMVVDKVVLSVGDNGNSKMKFPYFVDRSKGRGGGYLSELLLSREEMIVSILAHELRHAWQYRKRRGYRVWGARGQFSERDADAYAIRTTRKWRKQNYKDSIDLALNLSLQ